MSQVKCTSGQPPSPQTVQCNPPPHARVGPLCYHLYAEDFLRAAQALPQRPDRFPRVSYYLCCHSIELSLKAFLRLAGVSAKELRDPKKFGHNLERLLDRAFALQLRRVVPLSPEREQAIRRGNGYYGRKLYEYLDGPTGLLEALTGWRDRPPLDELMASAELLLARLKQPCLDHVNEPSGHSPS